MRSTRDHECCADARRSEPSRELAALGVARLDISETDHALVIQGVDRDGQVIARAELVTGRFDLADDDRGDVDGRQLVVRMHESTIRHESEGYATLDLPFPVNRANAGVFVTDPVVAGALAAWGIRIAAPPIPVGSLSLDVDYSHSCQYGSPTHTEAGYSTGCATSTYEGCVLMQGLGSARKFSKSGSEYGEFRCCEASNANSWQNQFVVRACTAPNSSSSCGTTGAGGCKVCWQTPVVNGETCFITTVGGNECRATYCAGDGGPDV